MGSSKKHKEKDREKSHKRKHKHRSRSRSRSRERKSKKHHKSSKDDHRIDFQESNTHQYQRDPHLKTANRNEFDSSQTNSPQESHVQQTGSYGYTNIDKGDGQQSIARGLPREIDQDQSGGGDLTLSIDETNALRAKLGLKPLETPGAKKTDDEIQTVTDRPDTHKPAVNLADVKRTENIKEKMEMIRQKRKLNQKLGKVKTLGDSDSDEDSALSWVKKTRKQEKEKDLAAKRAKMLEEMDEDFGVSDLIEQEFKPQTKKAPSYDSKDLSGLTVQHAQESFKEGRSVILTLQDKGILDDDEGDTLVNVNMIDDERTAVNIQNKKKLPQYNPYDDTTVDEFGMMKPKEVLDKYDDEVYGSKKEAFQLGSGGKYDASHERRMQEIKTELKQKGEHLTLAAPVLANEFYTTDEMTSFKKVKKKVRKIRKKVLKASDLTPLDNDMRHTEYGSRTRGQGYAKEEGEIEEEQHIEKTAIPGLDMEIDPPDPVNEVEILGPEEDLSGLVVDDDAGRELELALSKTRKLKHRKRVAAPEQELIRRGIEANAADTEDILASSHSTGLPVAAHVNNNMVLNSTSEFCRALGDIPTYGAAGNRDDEDEDLMDFEKEGDMSAVEATDHLAGWQTVDIDTRPVDITEEEKPALDDEPTIDSGLATTLMLAKKKGFIDEETGTKARRINLSMVVDDANYSIEDKRYEDLDEKFRKRERFTGGLTQDFKELKNYKPEFKLSYADEAGRELNCKEAFRQLSHRFHGKGSGKKKTEKRTKKQAEENLMKGMSSTDTPLQTLKMLKDKQKAEKSAYVVLSGSKGFTGGASISKP